MREDAPAEAWPRLDRMARDAATGDPESVARLLAEIAPLLVRYCRARLGRRGASYREADEVAGAAGRAVLAAVPGYEHGPFLNLLYSVATRTLDEVAPRGLPAAGPDLTGLLPTLPQPDRDIVLLRVATGLSAVETASVLGLSVGEVQVAQHRALTKLRTLL